SNICSFSIGSTGQGKIPQIKHHTKVNAIFYLSDCNAI
ncbi:unnamed protein product, partial [Callosobruchus maculatus]